MEWTARYERYVDTVHCNFLKKFPINQIRGGTIVQTTIFFCVCVLILGLSWCVLSDVSSADRWNRVTITTKKRTQSKCFRNAKDNGQVEGGEKHWNFGFGRRLLIDDGSSLIQKCFIDESLCCCFYKTVESGHGLADRLCSPLACLGWWWSWWWLTTLTGQLQPIPHVAGK